ncbi:hypothetical protein KC331_g22111, partial [Hortaea werneckii]
EGQQTNEDGTTGAHPTTENVGTPPPSHPTPVPAAQEMERSTSHQVLTRGTARANPLAALSDLATAAATHSQGGGPSSTLTRDQNPFAPVIPSYHAVSRSDKSFAGAPTPSGVGLVEGENDFEMMRRSGHHHHGLSNGYHAAADPEDLPDADAAAAAAEDAAAAALGGAEMRRQLLDQALGLPSITQPYRLPLIESGPAVIGRGVDRPNWTGFSDVRVYEQQRMRQQISNFGAGWGGGGKGRGCRDGRGGGRQDGGRG